jgi:hypothetical protein
VSYTHQEFKIGLSLSECTSNAVWDEDGWRQMRGAEGYERQFPDSAEEVSHQWVAPGLASIQAVTPEPTEECRNTLHRGLEEQHLICSGIIWGRSHLHIPVDTLVKHLPCVEGCTRLADEWEEHMFPVINVIGQKEVFKIRGNGFF